MIRGLYVGDICGNQLVANFLRVNISKIKASETVKSDYLQVIITKMSHQNDNSISEHTKGYNVV